MLPVSKSPFQFKRQLSKTKPKQKKSINKPQQRGLQLESWCILTAGLCCIPKIAPGEGEQVEAGFWIVLVLNILFKENKIFYLTVLLLLLF